MSAFSFSLKSLAAVSLLSTCLAAPILKAGTCPALNNQYSLGTGGTGGCHIPLNVLVIDAYPSAILIPPNANTYTGFQTNQDALRIRDSGDLDQRQIGSRALGRVLAKNSQYILNAAIGAGHVFVVSTGLPRPAGQPPPLPQLVLADYSIGKNIVSVRLARYQTDHILPVSFIHQWIQSLVNDPRYNALNCILPTSRSTDFSQSLANGIMNDACNLFSVPGWINSLIGTLITTTGTPDKTKYSAQAASFANAYFVATSGYFMNTARVLGQSMAVAINDQSVQTDFVNYAQNALNSAIAFTAVTTGWSGPELVMDQIDPQNLN